MSSRLDNSHLTQLYFIWLYFMWFYVYQRVHGENIDRYCKLIVFAQ